MPDSMTADDLESGRVRITEPQEGIDMDAGEEVLASITGVDTRSWEDPNSDDTYYYLDLNLEIGGSEYESFDGFSLNGGNIHENTGLGAFIDRLGVDLEELRGDEVDLSDLLVGEAFTFEAEEDEEGYINIARDDDSLPVVEPADSDTTVSSSSDSSDSDDDSDDDGQEQRDRVVSIVGEHSPAAEQDMKKHVAKEGGELVPVFNEMLDDDDSLIGTNDDGEVVIQ